MPATILTITDALCQFYVGATEPADWLTAEDFSCQVQTASIDATSNLQDVDATFCQGPVQVPAATSYTLNLAGLQDWTDAAGLSMFLLESDTLEGWVRVELPNQAVPPTAVAVCKVRFTAGSFGGAAGAPLTFTAAFPVQGKPDVTQAVAAAVAAEHEPA